MTRQEPIQDPNDLSETRRYPIWRYPTPPHIPSFPKPWRRPSIRLVG